MNTHPVRIPYANRPITGSGVQNTLAADPPTSPSHYVDASRMTSKRVLQPPRRTRPYPDAAVLRRRREPRGGRVPKETKKAIG